MASALYNDVSSHRDRLLDEVAAYHRKFDEIIDQRLGLTQAPAAQTPRQEPIHRRQNWSQVRAKYEASRREEMWRERIRVMEERDKQVEPVEEKDVSAE